MTYPARLDRALIAAMYDEGVLSGFRVSQRGAGANMSVDVAAGEAVIQGDDQANQGNYHVASTAVENKVVSAAPGSNSRIDIVVLQINDPNATGPAGDNMVPMVIAGTAAASPVAPATPASALLLATIGPITTSTTSITDAMITDARIFAGRRDAPGTISLLAGTRVPSGWLLCTGQAVSRTTYADLFDQLGTAYGVGDGSTTFTLPDLRNRVPVAKGTGTFATEGATGGSADAIVVAHTHTGPSHTHAIDHDHGSVVSNAESGHTHSYDVQSSGFKEAGSGADRVGATPTTSGTTGPSSGHVHSVDLPNFTGTSGAGGTGATGSTGASGTNANLPPYQVVGGFIIRT